MGRGSAGAIICGLGGLEGLRARRGAVLAFVVFAAVLGVAFFTALALGFVSFGLRLGLATIPPRDEAFGNRVLVVVLAIDYPL
jgi:hypothetical protein